MYHTNSVRNIMKVFVILAVLLFSQMVSAGSCIVASVPDTLAPEWVAVRRQYEIGFVPSIDPTFRPVVDANSPEWLAVRQQYDPTYMPPLTHTVDANSPEWLAVRRQYETSYVPVDVLSARLTPECDDKELL